MQISSKNVLLVQGCDAVAAIGEDPKLYKVPCGPGHAPAKILFKDVLRTDADELEVRACEYIRLAYAVCVPCSVCSFVEVGRAARPFCFIQKQRAQTSFESTTPRSQGTRSRREFYRIIGVYYAAGRIRLCKSRVCKGAE